MLSLKFPACFHCSVNKCSFYYLHVLGLVVAVTISGHNRIVCLTRLEQDTRVFRIPSFRWSASSYLKKNLTVCVRHFLSVLSNLPSKPFSSYKPFLQSHCPDRRLCVYVYVRACVSAWVHACVRVCVCACVRACVRACLRACVGGCARDVYVEF